MNELSDSGPDDEGRDAGVGRRTVNETVEGVAGMSSFTTAFWSSSCCALSVFVSEMTCSSILPADHHKYTRTMNSITKRFAVLPRTHLTSRRTCVTWSQYIPASRAPHDHRTHPGATTVLTQFRHMSLALSQSSRPSDIPKARSVILKSPTVEDLETQELDADVIPKDQINVVLTARAAEV